MIKKNMDMNVMRVVLAIVLIALYFLPYNVIVHLKNTWVRVVVMLLIVGVCLYDPIISLLLAIAFVAILQRVQDKKDNFTAPFNSPNTLKVKSVKFKSQTKRSNDNSFNGQEANGTKIFQKL
jgi:hypothetical protein